MFLPDLVVRSRRVVTPHGTRPAAIHIRRGKIAGVLDFDEVLPGSPTEDVEGVVIPGLIDTSLSARELESATRAAAAGGITTLVVQMEERQSCLSGQAGSPVLHTDVALWNDAEGTLLAAPSTLDDLQRLIASWRPGGARIHLQRVPSWEMLTPLFNAQRARVPISAGTTAHDLTVNANESDRRNREYLWAALANGLLRTVSSFDLTPLASMLPAVWAAARARGYTIEQLVDWMCGAPAKLAGLTRKGQIDPGFDADLVVFDSEGEAVLRTYLRGQQIDLQSAHGRSISRNVN